MRCLPAWRSGAREQSERGGCGDAGDKVYGWAERGFADQAAVKTVVPVRPVRVRWRSRAHCAPPACRPRRGHTEHNFPGGRLLVQRARDQRHPGGVCVVREKGLLRHVVGGRYDQRDPGQGLGQVGHSERSDVAIHHCRRVDRPQAPGQRVRLGHADIGGAVYGASQVRRVNPVRVDDGERADTRTNQVFGDAAAYRSGARDENPPARQGAHYRPDPLGGSGDAAARRRSGQRCKLRA